MKPRVVHLAPGHPTFDTRVFHKECRDLSGAGYEVTLVVRHDRDETVEGVRIIALPATKGRLDRFVGNTLRAARIAWRERADLYHLHDIEMLPVGLVLALTGHRVVYDSHEDYPKVAMSRSWIPSRLRPAVASVVRATERLAARRFAAVISAEDDGAARFPSDVVVIRNYARLSEFDRSLVPWSSKQRRVVYVGEINRERGAVEMLEIIRRIDGARLSLMGNLRDESLRTELLALDTDGQLDLHGFSDRATVADEIGAAMVGLVVWLPTPKHVGGAVPVKLFEYLAAGIPAVVSDFPTIRALVGDAGCVELVDPLDVDAMTAATRSLVDDPERARVMGRRGRDLVAEHFSWESQSVALVDLYTRLIR